MLTLNQLNCVTTGGPISATGKEISSRNAIKHGACASSTLILDDESLDDYLVLESRWFQGYFIDPDNKATVYEAELIRDAARADWFFRRSERKYAEAEAAMTNAVPDVLMWGDDHHNTLARYLRYRTAGANSVIRHRKVIEDYRRNRDAELSRARNAQIQNEKLASVQATAKAKRETVRQNTSPESAWDEHLEALCQHAIDLDQPSVHTPPTDPASK